MVSLQSNNLNFFFFFLKLFWNGWHFQPFFNGIEYVLVHMNDRILNNYFQGYTGPWTNSFFVPNWKKKLNEQSDWRTLVFRISINFLNEMPHIALSQILLSTPLKIFSFEWFHYWIIWLELNAFFYNSEGSISEQIYFVMWYLCDISPNIFMFIYISLSRVFLSVSTWNWRDTKVFKPG